MSSRFFRFLLLLGGVLFVSCNQPFDPRGTQDRRLVVFSILSTDRSAQVVRVERDYMPQGYDALEYSSDNSVLGATVLLKAGSVTYRLRDTTLTRGDTSRYKSALRGYIASSFTPEYGKSYEVTVQSAQFSSVHASVTVPSKPSLSIDASSVYVLDNPSRSPTNADILFPITCGTNVRGYIARLFVEYDVLKGGEWISERAEMPVSYAYSGLRDFKHVLYGRLMPLPPNRRAVGLYNNELYRKALVSIAYGKYNSTRTIFNRAVFQVLQLDPNSYNYYFTTHAYNDPHSIRLDEPSYSNVVGGLGLVGAYTLDSLIHMLPEDFDFNKR